MTGDPLDFAEALAERERIAGINRVRAALRSGGSEDCSDCGDEIPAARRAALPSATRCAFCQSRREARG